MDYSLAAVPPAIPRRCRVSFSQSHQAGEHQRNYVNFSAPQNGVAARRDKQSASPATDYDATPHHDLDGDRVKRSDGVETDRPPTAARPSASSLPEVISSLITSLSLVSRPDSNVVDSPASVDPRSTTTPVSVADITPVSEPYKGLFGVDYGAYSQGHCGDCASSPGDIVTSPPDVPIIKASSGLSPSTAAKPSKCASSTRETPVRASLLSWRSSNSAFTKPRPPSPASLTSAVENIGILSVERTTGPTSPEVKTVKKQTSRDSWGATKTVRSARGLVYMSSKESFPGEIEADRNRRSVRSSCVLALDFSAFEANLVKTERPITGEPNGYSSYIKEADDAILMSTSPNSIPTRESSLFQNRSSARRSFLSARASRTSRRETKTNGDEAIHESDESRPAQDHKPWDGRTHQRRSEGSKPTSDLQIIQFSDTRQRSITDASFSQPRPRAYSASLGKAPVSMAISETDYDEGAPSPAIAQGRHRDREYGPEVCRLRRSGLHSEGHNSETGGRNLKPKRSNGLLKRRSGAVALSVEKSPDGTPNCRISQSEQPHVAYERPQSADSIDDDVECFLSSQRLTQKIRHPQTGRTISFSEVGDPKGSAVFCCVGMGLTRYIMAFYDELALTLKLRLITPDRPGIGDSDPYADGTTTPLSWPDDVYTICQSLRITKFSILAHSAGAIYALATALRMPQHIRGRIHLLAPWIPPSQMTVFGASAQTLHPPTNAIPTSQRILRALPTPILKAANSSFMSATSSSITSSLPKQKRAKRDKKDDRSSRATSAPSTVDDKDPNNSHSDKPLRELTLILPADLSMSATENMDQIRPTTANASVPGRSLHHRWQRSTSSMGRQSTKDSLKPDPCPSADTLSLSKRQQIYDSRLTHAIWQLATTGANPAVDLLVCLERRHNIGFRYVDITRPVVIHHGSRDNRVPVDNVRWLGKTMRRCEVRVLEGEGHGLMASAQVMGGVLMEVSKEWEEWGMMTGQPAGSLRRKGIGSMSTIGQAR